MKNKLFLLVVISFFISIGDVYSFNNYAPDQDTETTARKRRKSKKRGKKDEKKMLLTLTGGLTMPIGDDLTLVSANAWRSMDEYTKYISNQPNTTSSGFIGDLSFSYNFIPNLGAGISFRYQNLPISNTVTLDRNGDIYHMYTTTEGTSWGMFSIMAGPIGKIQAGDALALYGKVYAGVSFVSSPEFTFTNSYKPDDEYVKAYTIPSAPSTSATAFSYMIGIGASYDLSESVCLMAGLDFMQAFPAYTNMDINLDITNIGSLDDLMNQAKVKAGVLNTFSFTIGVGFKF